MDEIEKALQYRQRVERVVGESDPMDILASTIMDLRAQVEGLNEQQLLYKVAHQWSVMDVLQHLIDAELVNGYRVRMVLSENNPLLPGYRQEFWVGRYHHYQELEEILKAFSVFRIHNLGLLKTLEPQELKRTYQHMHRGEECLKDLMVLMAGHDLIHKEQMARIMQNF